MITTTQLDRLTEGWPDDPGNFELQSFAAGLRSDRPELSAPALDRIGSRLQNELNRQSTPPAPLRLAGQVRSAAQWMSRVDFSPHVRRLIPLATAATVLLATGIWFGVHPGHRTGDGPAQLHPTPSTPIVQHPARPDPLKPAPAPHPIIVTP